MLNKWSNCNNRSQERRNIQVQVVMPRASPDYIYSVFQSRQVVPLSFSLSRTRILSNEIGDLFCIFAQCTPKLWILPQKLPLQLTQGPQIAQSFPILSPSFRLSLSDYIFLSLYLSLSLSRSLWTLPFLFTFFHPSQYELINGPLRLKILVYLYVYTCVVRRMLTCCQALGSARKRLFPIFDVGGIREIIIIDKTFDNGL